MPDDTVLTNASGVGTVIEGIQSAENIRKKEGATSGSNVGSAAKSFSYMSGYPSDSEAGLRIEGKYSSLNSLAEILLRQSGKGG